MPTPDAPLSTYDMRKQLQYVTDMKAHILVAGLALFFCAAIHAAVKPLAIWNGEFPVKNKTLSRNDIKLEFGSDLLPKGQYFQVTRSVACARLTPKDEASMGQSIIANISEISPSDRDSVLFDCFVGTNDQYWLLIDKDGRLSVNTSNEYAKASEVEKVPSETIDFSYPLIWHVRHSRQGEVVWIGGWDASPYQYTLDCGKSKRSNDRLLV